MSNLLKKTKNKREKSVAGDPKSNVPNILFQVLSYTLWLWTLGMLLSVLIGLIAYVVINNNSNSVWMVYVSSSLLVLLPLAIITDRHYISASSDNKERSTLSSILMVIVSAGVAISVVISLVVVVYTLTDLLINVDGDVKDRIVVILSALLVAKVMSLYFLKVTNNQKFIYASKYFNKVAIALSVIALIGVIVLPLKNEMDRKQDRLIEQSYYSLSSDIDQYYRDNDKLPSSLDKVDLSVESQQAVDTGRVKYQPDDTPGALETDEASYQICVDWQYKLGSSDDYSYGSRSSSFSEYTGHDAGRECYREYVY